MKRAILFTSLILVAVIFIGCTTATDGITQDTADTLEEVVEPDIVIEDNIFSDKTEYEFGTSTEVYITAPKVKADKYGESVDGINQLIEMNIDTVKNEYLNDVAMNEGMEGSVSTSRMLTYDVYNAEDGLVSLMLKYVFINGFSNTTTAYRSLNFDLTENKVLSLTDIVSEEDIPFIKAKILERMREDPDKYFSTEDDALDAIDITYSFLLSDSTVYIYFEEYAIAPRAQGMQMFEIDLNELG